MADIWAHCGGCDRWFYPERLDGQALDGSQPDPAHAARCPVCFERPDVVEERVSDEGAADGVGGSPADQTHASV